jgi:hypothetical protein
MRTRRYGPDIFGCSPVLFIDYFWPRNYFGCARRMNYLRRRDYFGCARRMNYLGWRNYFGCAAARTIFGRATISAAPARTSSFRHIR